MMAQAKNLAHLGDTNRAYERYGLTRCVRPLSLIASGNLGRTVRLPAGSLAGAAPGRTTLGNSMVRVIPRAITARAQAGSTRIIRGGRPGPAFSVYDDDGREYSEGLDLDDLPQIPGRITNEDIVVHPPVNLTRNGHMDGSHEEVLGRVLDVPGVYIWFIREPQSSLTSHGKEDNPKIAVYIGKSGGERITAKMRGRFRFYVNPDGTIGPKAEAAKCLQILEPQLRGFDVGAIFLTGMKNPRELEKKLLECINTPLNDILNGGRRQISIRKPWGTATMDDYPPVLENLWIWTKVMKPLQKKRAEQERASLVKWWKLVGVL